MVSWIVEPEPWLLEAFLIADLDVPLNLDGNSHNRFHPELTVARAKAVARALALPVIPNPGIGGRSDRSCFRPDYLTIVGSSSATMFAERVG